MAEPTETQTPLEKTTMQDISAAPSRPQVDNQPTKVINVQSVALADATAKQKPSLWTWRMFQLYGCLFIAILNAAVNGYDGSVMGSINSYAQYREYFHFSLTEGTPSTGIVYAIFTIGNIVGSFIAGPCADWRGRRWGMFFGAAVIVIGSVVQGSAHNLAAFMIGRFMLGLGASLGPSAALPYVSEMAHPAFRGAMTGVYTTFYFVGAIPGTFIPYGTSFIQSTQAWRIPLYLQMTYSGIVLVGCLFLPESPRWLMANDRHEEALEIMAKYHGEGDPNSPIVQLEYREMQEEISLTGADKRWWDFRELFNTREVRYRTMLTIAIAIFSQGLGNGAVSYYYPQMLAGAGISDNHRQLLLQGMQSVVSFAGALIGAAYTDKWGRRPQLVISTSIMVALFAIVLALNATNITTLADGTIVAKSQAKANAEIAMIFIFSFVFAAGWTPLQGLYAVEVLRFESRAKGMALYTFWGNIASFYNTFVTGIAFTNSGWRYYFLFVFWDLFTAVFIYFFFVETKNRTLEEMTDIFNAPNPVKYSIQKKEVIIHGSEGVTEVLDKGEKEIEV